MRSFHPESEFKGNSQVYSTRSCIGHLEVWGSYVANRRRAPVLAGCAVPHDGDNGAANCVPLWSGPFTRRETWMTSPVFTRVQARRSEVRLILPHRPRVNDKWHFPFVIFGIFVDLFGGFCWIPRNGLWLKPILPISTLHLWNPSTGHLPSFRALTPAWQGAADTKKAGADEKREVGCFFVGFFFPEEGGGLKWMHSGG